VTNPRPVDVTHSSAAPPVVQSVGLETRAGLVRQIRITLGGTLVAADADNPANYRIVLAGRDGKLGTKDDHVLIPRSASYDVLTGLITLTPRKLFALKPAAGLRLISSGLHDTRGQALDGDHDGSPGGDYLGKLTRKLSQAAKVRFAGLRGRR